MRDYTDYRGSVYDNEKKLWNNGVKSKLEFNYEEFEDYKREILKNLILKNINKQEMDFLQLLWQKKVIM